jgi:hypothetical protein
MNEVVAVYILLALKIVGIVVCANKANDLNRSTGGWGFFGFVSPILAMIWIHSMNPVIKWDENVKIDKKQE